MGAANFVSNNCRVIPTRLTTTASTVCHTAKGFTHIIAVRIVNFHATSTPVVALTFTPVVGGATYTLAANATLAVGGVLDIRFDAFQVNDGDLISVQSSIATTTDVFIFVAEVPGRSS